MTMLMNQMGWKTDNEGKPFFVLGQKIFYHDGTIKDASLARHVPSAAKGFRSAGDLNLWAEATKLLDQPGMEPYAFALLCGFAAPLTKFTGFAGALVSMVGDSGIGKTLMLRFNQSIYGFHEDLIMLKDDTRNALISRLGTYGNLPMAIDEVTNQDGLELSEFVYRITQGRDKVRLTKNSEERKVINNWNTLACVSTNSSLIDKLSGLKHDASAEINRVFMKRHGYRSSCVSRPSLRSISMCAFAPICTERAVGRRVRTPSMRRTCPPPKTKPSATSEN
jgi:uncharacterized protein (DUF927 family)